MKQHQTYVPVGCDFVDHIEILATQRRNTVLVYQDETGVEQQTKAVLKTWETKNKEEFLITQDGLRLRLDHVLSIDGVVNNATCSF